MLEVHILKVTHGTTEEAKKLLPYIKECDVYSPEFAFGTEKVAKVTEREWLGILSKSRSKMKEYVLSGCAPPNNPEVQQLNAYRLKEFEQVYLNQKPIWFAERFSENVASDLTERERAMFSNINESIRHLPSADESAFYRQMMDALALLAGTCDLRDKHIAANLKQALPYIKELYPTFQTKDPINLTIRIGLMHNIGKYVTDDGELKILPSVDLSGNIEPIVVALQKAFAREGDSAEVRRLALAYGVRMISKKTDNPIPEEKLLNASSEELREMLSQVIG